MINSNKTINQCYLVIKVIHQPPFSTNKKNFSNNLKLSLKDLLKMIKTKNNLMIVVLISFRKKIIKTKTSFNFFSLKISAVVITLLFDFLNLCYSRSII